MLNKKADRLPKNEVDEVDDDDDDEPRAPTIEEVNEDLQRHKADTARRFEANEDRLRSATKSLGDRLNHLDALIERRQKKEREKDADAS